jgi:type IV pilus assembly protein PilM
MGLGQLLNSTTPPIAVDFGASSLKVLQISSGDRRSLIAASCVQTPQELLGDPAARLDFQLSALPGVIKKGQFRGRRLMISAPAPQTWVQHLQVNKAEGADLRQLVTMQLQTQTGYDPANLVIRHYEVCEMSRGSSSRTETICVATRRGLVLKMLETLRKQKLEVVGIHSEHLALARAMPTLVGESEGGEAEATVAIDLGYASTKLVITHGDQPVFAKTIEISGATLDEEAASQLGCGMLAARERRLRAESLVCERAVAASAGGGATGIPALDAQGSDEPADDPARATNTLDLSEAIEGVTDEAAMCLRYHRALFPERVVTQALFVGGEARHEGLCRALAERMRLSAHVAEPLAAVDGASDAGRVVNIDFSEPQPGWAVALGLCLSPADI